MGFDVSRIARVAGGATLCLTLGFVGWFLNSPEEAVSQRKGLSSHRTTVEYEAEASSLTLAPGWTWPDRPVREVAPDGVRMEYERGYGKQAADYYWYCSWASQAVDPKASKVDRRHALRQVLTIRDKYYFTRALAAVSKPDFDRLLTLAERGNTRALAQDVALNCPRSPAA